MKALSLKGTRDIESFEEQLRDWVLSTVLAVYRKNGFARISTPIIEDAENISKSDGGDNLNLVFRVLKRGEKFDEALDLIKEGKCKGGAVDALSDIALRYDLTLPLVRFYSGHKESLPKPFKVIQADKVYRAERPQKGRLREFMQCDIDIIGDDSINAEIELIDVTARALEAVGFKDFCVNINDRRLLRSLLLQAGFSEDSLDSVCVTIDKLDKIGQDGVVAELLEKGFDKRAIDGFIKSLSDLEKSFQDFDDKGGEKSAGENNGAFANDVSELASNGELFDKSFDNEGAVSGNGDSGENCTKTYKAGFQDFCKARDLQTVIKSAKKLGKGRYSIRFNPTLVRGQGYYTGLVFEITTADLGQAIAGGGRYDHMIEKFTRVPTSAAGFSIGFERICAILMEKGFSIPDARKKCALIFEEQKGADFVAVLEAAKELQKTFDVGIFKKAKNAKAQYASLEASGYEHFALMKDGVAVVKNSEAKS